MSKQDRLGDHMHTPHVLYVAWGYPPSRAPGMYRALATANAFADEGWRVTVLTATEDSFARTGGSDPESVTAVDDRITVVRIPFDPPLGETDLARWGRIRVYSTMLWNALRWFTSRFGFPEPKYGSWRGPLRRTAREIHRSDPIDLVVGSANPNVDFVPGYDLYRRFGVPYAMDHRDAWHVSVYTGKRVGRPWSRSRRIERRMIRNATEVWFVNEELRRWHAQEHPKQAARFHVVANGYDRGFIDDDWHRSASAEKGLEFGYLGTIYGPIPLLEALEGWRIARRRSDVLSRSRLNLYGRLGFGSDPDTLTVSLLDEFASEGVIYHGPVSKTKVSDIYRNLDALLLIIGPSRFTTSGKVFEYAATGLPIAGLFDPGSGVARVLDGHPRSISANRVTADEFGDVILHVSQLALSSTPELQDSARAWAKPLERGAQLLPRIRALRTRLRSPL